MAVQCLPNKSLHYPAFIIWQVATRQHYDKYPIYGAEPEMEPDGVGVRVYTKGGEWALNTAGEVRKTYLQRGLLRAVNVHIPSF